MKDLALDLTASLNRVQLAALNASQALNLIRNELLKSNAKSHGIICLFGTFLTTHGIGTVTATATTATTVGLIRAAFQMFKFAQTILLILNVFQLTFDKNK